MVAWCMPFRFSARSSLGLVLAVLALAGCVGPQPTPSAQVTTTPDAQAAVPAADAAGTARLISPAQSPPISTPRTAPGPTSAPAPLETSADGLSQNTWIKGRIEGLVQLYNISPAGRRWLEGYDLRQMVGRPGWFGSFGNDGWAGVGQAIPSSILHEVSHSYYGAFQVSGRPELSWTRQPGEELSPAMERYHEDLVTFMLQPPDSYEPLRERFRNLPHLSRPGNRDLFHFGEADLLFTAGGNLLLIPPILRKYFELFLSEGRFSTWEDAIAWYLGLHPQDRELASAYMGIAHLPIRRYRSLEPSESTRVDVDIRAVLEREERQRLVDFARQFEAIMANEFGFVDAAGVDASFQFWRGYLKDMLTLQKAHPQVLAMAGGKGPQLGETLDTFLRAAELSHAQQVEFFEERLKDPFLMNFAALLPNRVLMALFDRPVDELPEGPAGVVTGRFTRKLSDYARAVNDALLTGRDDADKGAESLEGLLDALSDDAQEKDLGLVFGLMQDADAVTAEQLVNRLRDEVILRTLRNNPGALRNGVISPERLLEALAITPRHTPTDIVRGLETLFEHSSGNFEIDKPFSQRAFGVISEVADEDLGLGLALLRDADVPLLDFIRSLPGPSARILTSDVSEAARLVANPKGYAHSAPGIVHGLMSVDPVLAARAVVEMEEQGRDDLATESLIVFAFDATRLRTVPSLELSLEGDRDFLVYLVDHQGPEWVKQHVATALRKYQREVELERIDSRFIEEYGTTLREIVRLERNGDSREALAAVLNQAFQEAGLPPLGAFGSP